MRLNLPTVPFHEDALQRVVAVLTREMINALDVREAVAHIHLRSPAGKVYRVTVDDTGALQTTLVQG